MTTSQDTVRALREALQFSPDNVPLRQHLADTLLSLELAEEAEQEYRYALGLQPEAADLKLGLAKSFYYQGKQSQSLVIVEDLVKRSECPALAYILHARLLLNGGAVQQAKVQYENAIALDDKAADLGLAQLLGIDPNYPSRDAVGNRVGDSITDDVLEFDESSLERPEVSFQDVGGMDTVKDEIRLKIIYPLTQADLYRAYGKTIGGGILLYGPPGCGKTYLARATAGEINSHFISVGINDVLDMWLGNSPRSPALCAILR
jgi:transitional endoplasmic reticulum ATPase